MNVRLKQCLYNSMLSKPVRASDSVTQTVYYHRGGCMWTITQSVQISVVMGSIISWASGSILHARVSLQYKNNLTVSTLTWSPEQSNILNQTDYDIAQHYCIPLNTLYIYHSHLKTLSQKDIFCDNKIFIMLLFCSRLPILMKETTPLLVIFFPQKADCRKTFESPDGLIRGVGPIYFHIL